MWGKKKKMFKIYYQKLSGFQTLEPTVQYNGMENNIDMWVWLKHIFKMPEKKFLPTFLSLKIKNTSITRCKK